MDPVNQIIMDYEGRLNKSVAQGMITAVTSTQATLIAAKKMQLDVYVA